MHNSIVAKTLKKYLKFGKLLQLFDGAERRRVELEDFSSQTHPVFVARSLFFHALEDIFSPLDQRSR